MLETAQRLLTVDDLSNLLGYSKPYIYNLVSRREIPFLKLSRKALRFDTQEIQKWIQDRNRAEQCREAEVA